MSLKYLLDTNVLSEPLRPAPARKVLTRLRRHEGETAIAAVVWHEFFYGWARLPKSRRKTAIERYLEDVVSVSFPILDYDRAAAEWHAVARVKLAAAGKTASFVAGQIAAIASVNDLVLVTANKADFKAFAGLQVESWA